MSGRERQTRGTVPMSAQAEAARRERNVIGVLGRNWHYVVSPLIFVSLVVIWQTSVTLLHVPVYILPSPSEIFYALMNGLNLHDMWGAQRFYIHIVVTTYEAGLGFIIGVVTGVAMGGIIAQSPTLDAIIKPYVMGFQSLPKVAVAPLIVLWFGFGLESKVVLVALLVFFPLMINSSVGFRSVDRNMMEMLRALSASRWQIFRTVQIPAALPFIFAGLEMGVVYAFLGAVVGEFVGGTKGLGVEIVQLTAAMDIAGMFAVLLILAGLGVGASKLLQVVRRRVLYWAPSEHVG